jgi:ABC-type transport system involved in cytochrome bd biosynthesis fused ATPase/permease subunit
MLLLLQIPIPATQPDPVAANIVLVAGAVGSVLTILTGTITAIMLLIKMLGELRAVSANQAVAATQQAKDSELLQTTHTLVNGQSKLLEANARREGVDEGVAQERADVAGKDAEAVVKAQALQEATDAGFLAGQAAPTPPPAPGGSPPVIPPPTPPPSPTGPPPVKPLIPPS